MTDNESRIDVRNIMTTKEFWRWLDTCPANFDEDGNRVANPAWDLQPPDDAETIVIGFRVKDKD
tara:strand:+ start:81 stop:272 length:192 start_codon:yes stop_codon:yes gene_type:complete